MRYCVFVLLLCLGILFYLGMSTASSDHAVAFDPRRPSTLVWITMRGVRVVFAQARDLSQGFVDAVGNPQRERVKRHLPLEGVHH